METPFHSIQTVNSRQTSIKVRIYSRNLNDENTSSSSEPKWCDMFIENKEPIAWGGTWTSQMPISHKVDIIIRYENILYRSSQWKDFSPIFQKMEGHK